MDKTYLLLRENQESGPYQLEELLLKQLGERDLVWIEGESRAWIKPASVESLQPFLSNNFQKPAVDESEIVLNHQPRFKRKKSVNKYLVALTILAGSFSGWMIAKDFHEQDRLRVAAAGNPEQPENNKLYISSTTAANEPFLENSLPEVREEIKKENKPAISAGPAIEPAIVVSQEQNDTRPISEETEIAGNSSENTDEQTAPEKKNIFKKLGDWLKGGKELDEEKQNEGKQVNIKESVTVSVITGDNWMMGIKGQQAKIFNRSNANLQFGKVEFLYYSEQNSIIDKKTIDIPGIEAGKSKTLAIPDHKLADRVEAIVVDAVGVE